MKLLVTVIRSTGKSIQRRILIIISRHRGREPLKQNGCTSCAKQRQMKQSKFNKRDSVQRAKRTKQLWCYNGLQRHRKRRYLNLKKMKTIQKK